MLLKYSHISPLYWKYKTKQKKMMKSIYTMTQLNFPFYHMWVVRNPFLNSEKKNIFRLSIFNQHMHISQKCSSENTLNWRKRKMAEQYFPLKTPSYVTSHFIPFQPPILSILNECARKLSVNWEPKITYSSHLPVCRRSKTILAHCITETGIVNLFCGLSVCDLVCFSIFVFSFFRRVKILNVWLKMKRKELIVRCSSFARSLSVCSKSITISQNK